MYEMNGAQRQAEHYKLRQKQSRKNAEKHKLGYRYASRFLKHYVNTIAWLGIGKKEKNVS